jgi:hypothetical protein
MKDCFFIRKILFRSILFIGIPLSALDAQTLSSKYSIADYNPIEIPGGYGKCGNKLLGQLKNPSELNIGVALGYSDLTDEHFDLVTDTFTLSTLVNNLTQKCKYSKQGFCEFKWVTGDEHEVNLYTRNIQAPNGQYILINIYTMNSSFSIGNSDNKTKFKTEQEQKTQIARDFYAWSLKNADMVFYEGHSRDGGGPDFAPPRPSHSGTVNYPWYHKNKPGLKFLLAALNEAQIKPSNLGLFSCASRGHFLKSLKKHAPKTKLYLSTKVVEAGKTKSALMRTLESVLNFECDTDLKTRLVGTSFVIE